MPQITPFLWFDKEAEEAAKYYVSIFKNSKIDSVSRYGEAGPMPAGTAMVVEFQLDGQDIMALNGGQPAGIEGQPPVSLFVSCKTQADVDHFWDSLAVGGKKLQCGWLTDKFGITWNIVPEGLSELLGGDDVAGSQRAMKAMLEMEKLDIDELRRAYKGEGVAT